MLKPLRFRVQLGFDDYLESVDSGLVRWIEKKGHDIVASTQQRIPKKTTAAARSTYLVTELHSGIDEALSQAKAVKPEVVLYEQDEIPHHLQAFIVVAVIYGAVLEFGGAVSRNGERPFLTPSVDEHAADFLAGCAAILSRGGLR